MIFTKTMMAVISLDRPSCPGQPMVCNQVGRAVHLEWSSPSGSASHVIMEYVVEYREAGTVYQRCLFLLLSTRK